MNDIELKGCSPVPLAHYLKALGILRLVSEQKDSGARGYWRNDRFHLVTTLRENEVVEFFQNEYEPTPVVSPWNGGSGFGPKDYQDAIKTIESSTSPRFQKYRETIKIARKIRQEMGIEEKVTKEKKEELLLRCRNQLGEEGLKWLDSVYVLTEEGIKFPPILGTGGNDGRLDFSKNYMQNICAYLNFNNNNNPDEKSRNVLKNSLFAYATNDMENNAIGQFFPSATGGANAQAGFESNSNMNPWDYILMIEGALLFASACTRKFRGLKEGTLSYPFSVRTIAAGFGSSAKDDESSSRPEVWMPIWESPASVMELKIIFAEGRSTIGKRNAQNSIDFARAVATLGVDRGISEFQRYGFMVRNGLAYFATPLGRFRVKRQPQVDLINEIDSWLNRFRSKASSDKAPSSIKRASNNLDKAVMNLCTIEGPLRMQKVLIELGRCEKEMVKSPKWTKDTAYMKPVPYISKRWLEECDDGSVEYRLAVSLASTYGKYGDRYFSIRKNLEPVIEADYPFFKFDNNEDMNEVVDTSGELPGILNAIMARRIMKSQQKGCETFPDRAAKYTNPGDIADFIEGRVNERKILDLFWGMALVNYRDVGKIDIKKREIKNDLLPDGGYMLMKLCYCGTEINEKEIPIVPQIHRLSAGGGGSRAIEQAVRRLWASGVALVVNNIYIPPRKAKRIAAALLFPVHKTYIDKFLIRVTRGNSISEDETIEEEE